MVGHTRARNLIVATRSPDTLMPIAVGLDPLNFSHGEQSRSLDGKHARSRACGAVLAVLFLGPTLRAQDLKLATTIETGSTNGDLDTRRILLGKPCDASWSSVGGGVGGNYLLALKVFEDGNGAALYAGGAFDSAGNTSVNNIARWNGETWSELGSGVTGLVESLTVFDDGGGAALYVGGGFFTAGEEWANSIARWDGESWSVLGDVLGNGVDDTVWAMTVFNDGEGEALYVGGHITTAAGRFGAVIEANRIARWDGQAWSALGSGMSGEGSPFGGLVVHTLTVFDDGTGPALYAGGYFTIAGGLEANRIARWDGQSWSALGSGMDGPVLDMTVFDDGSGPALYAGGSFDTAGGVEASSIARWDGESWSALGSGLDGSGWVGALTVFDDGAGPALYVGGSFSAAGGESANYIARWDGQFWSPLGQGLGPVVRTLSVFDEGGGSSLFAGGVFDSAGGEPADQIARWGCPPPCPWDLDDDGQVRVPDLIMLLGAWGLCPEPCEPQQTCPADLDGDCQVRVPDLIALLAKWGVCP